MTLFKATALPARGNALFLILIAVALLAALSYAITTSGRGTTDVKREQSILEAANLIQFAGEVEVAINRLKLINGCTDTQISFANTVYLSTTNAISSPEGNYPGAPADKHCHLFAPAGAGLTAKTFPKLAVSPQTFGGLTSGHGSLNFGAVNGVGTSEADLILAFPHISQQACIDILKRVQPAANINTYASCTWTPFQSVYTPIPVCPASVTNVKTWCAIDTNNGGAAYFYHVILER